jgi:hypothetical protein
MVAVCSAEASVYFYRTRRQIPEAIALPILLMLYVTQEIDEEFANERSWSRPPVVKVHLLSALHSCLYTNTWF